MPERGRKDLAEVQEGSGDPPKGPGGVGRHNQMPGRGQKSLAEVREGSGSPPGDLGVGRQSLTEVQ